MRKSGYRFFAEIRSKFLTEKAAAFIRGLPVCAIFVKVRLKDHEQAGEARVNILRLVLLGLATLAVIVGGAALLRQAPPANAPETVSSRPAAFQPSPSQITAARKVLDEKLAAAPDYVEFFNRLDKAFPDEYQAFLTSLARRLAMAGEIRSADFLIAEAVRSLRLSRGLLAAKAGDPALEHIFELQALMLRALAAKDPHLCVSFLNGDESQDFFEFSAQNRGLVAAMGLAGLEAIKDGEVKGIERPPPAGRDFDVLEQALRAKGLETPEIVLLLDGKPSDPPITDEKLCQAGLIYLEVLTGLPEPLRLRIYGFAVELMARS